MWCRPGARRWRPTWWSSTTTCSSPTWRCATAAWPSCCPPSTRRCSTRRTSWSMPACSSWADAGHGADAGLGARPAGRRATRRRAAWRPGTSGRRPREGRARPAPGAGRRAARRARPAQAALGRARRQPALAARCRPGRGGRRGCRGAGRHWWRSAPDFTRLQQRAQEIAALTHAFRRAAGRRPRALDRPVAAAGAAGRVAAGHPRHAGRAARAARRGPGSSPRPRWATTTR
jgi:hypothetical protein